MPKRTFLQKPKTYDPQKHSLDGFWMSEKLDGFSCFWDGGISKGLKTSEIPWANTAKDKKDFIATGLWSPNGKPYFAPSGWLDKLPKGIPLHGELFAGRGNHSTVKKVCRKQTPVEAEWENITFEIFDIVSLDEILYDSVVDLPGYKKELLSVREWIRARGGNFFYPPLLNKFKLRYEFFKSSQMFNSTARMIKQIPITSKQHAEEFATHVLTLGGEGVVFRDPNAAYSCTRTSSVLKCKPELDAEATVIGCKSGRETTKGSKLLGLMGALLVEWNDKEFYISGFTDKERILTTAEHSAISAKRLAEDHAVFNPDKRMPPAIQPIEFPIGSTVTFKYRELTDDGIPKEARYWRKREKGEG